MSEEEKKLAEDYDNLTKKIKDLDLLLGKTKSKLKSSKLKQCNEVLVVNEINNIEKQIKYHIFARNKISDKLYGTMPNKWGDIWV